MDMYCLTENKIKFKARCRTFIYGVNIGASLSRAICYNNIYYIFSKWLFETIIIIILLYCNGLFSSQSERSVFFSLILWLLLIFFCSPKSHGTTNTILTMYSITWAQWSHYFFVNQWRRRDTCSESPPPRVNAVRGSGPREIQPRFLILRSIHNNNNTNTLCYKCLPAKNVQK